MSSSSSPSQSVNPTDPPVPIQLSFPLPHSSSTQVHIHLTVLSKCIILFLSTSTGGASASAPTSLSNLVYAMPDQSNPTGVPLSTPLYTQPSTIDMPTRLARLIARKTLMPAYVGGEVTFESAAGGGDIAEEMEGLRKVMKVVLEALRRENVLPEATQGSYGQ